MLSYEGTTCTYQAEGLFPSPKELAVDGSGMEPLEPTGGGGVGVEERGIAMTPFRTKKRSKKLYMYFLDAHNFCSHNSKTDRNY